MTARTGRDKRNAVRRVEGSAVERWGVVLETVLVRLGNANV